MSKILHDVISENLSISVRRCSIISLKKSFTIANFYDIENTIIFPLNGKLRYGKNKRKLEKNSALFISSHSTELLSFGSSRLKLLHMRILLMKNQNIFLMILIQIQNQHVKVF